MATNSDLKKFAQSARRQLREQVAGRLEQALGVDSVEVREKKNAVDQLKKQIAEHGKAEVIDKVAYIWFNRFCALRYMDVNLYNPVRVVSPAPGNVQPELLQEAKAAYLLEEWKKFVDAEKVLGLLNGSIRAENSQQEAYRRLLVGVCNAYSRIMPFMFEAIEDYTELLMPQDLLSENSVLTQTRLAMSDEACQDVEVIGWLYQYYISERKDEVFEQVKNGKKIEAEDIPAVTQLFTPHWIVRYLVENSLGRLWLLNHPDSRIIEKMEYYIKPVDEETDYLQISSPEELKICDPACGSGHMLTYAFDLLYAIYEEQGYDPIAIPSLILEKNLYGIEIDERAGALAAFALVMKARGKDKRFFTRGLQPNVCVLENVSFSDQELKEYMNAVGRDLFTEPLLQTLKQFEQARNFGSLIQPVLTNPAYIRQMLAEKNLAGNLFLFGIHEKVMTVLRQSEYLSPIFHVVIANPPYMGSGGMNKQLKDFVGSEYPNSKNDLMTCFMERNLSFSRTNSFIGMINLPSWLFLDSFNEFRHNLITSTTIQSLLHLGRGMFGADFGSVSFILKNSKRINFLGTYRRLFVKQSEVASVDELEKRFLDKQYGSYIVNQDEFSSLPGCFIGYWISPHMRRAFMDFDSLEDIADARIGMATGRNEYYVRNWYEVNLSNIGLNVASREEAKMSGKKWFPHAKGGEYRKWYGNIDYVVNWQNDGYELQTTLHPSGMRVWAHNFNLDQIFKPAICWTTVTIADTSFRYHPAGFLYDAAAGLCQPKQPDDMFLVLGALNSRVSINAIKLLNPTVNLAPGYLGKIPIDRGAAKIAASYVKKNVDLSKTDWDSFETSWDFTTSPFLSEGDRHKLNSTFEELRSHWREMTNESKKSEEEINRVFIRAFDLQNEMVSEISHKEITLTCNPYYRYREIGNSESFEKLLFADTLKEFISYAVGCMFGRYSLDKPGLILANQGETLQDYLRQVPDPTFLPDEDNVIPVIGGDWFQDDITERFKKFLKVTFGEEHYSENLQFIEEAIGRDIESYFLKEFYDYHIKMYKKRPIYWMFSSPKGTFNALIYMHRYNKDTVSILLNDYLKQFRVKLESRKSYAEKLSISASGSQRERTIALKELETLKKQLEEITTYENKVIFPLATQQIEIDLDDGVKANYPKFGEALVPIKGL